MAEEQKNPEVEAAKAEAASTRENISQYTDTASQIPDSDIFINHPITDEEGNPDPYMMHYEGPLGMFDYDKREFQLMDMPVKESEYGPSSTTQILHYVGTETDGKKIQVPEGVEDATMMFSQTDIETAPMLPEGVKNGFGTFMNCHNLESATAPLPDTLRNASFMFQNCENMQEGPARVKGTVENADYMFIGCASMRDTPRFYEGTESMNGTFINCKSLRNTPKIPSSVTQASDTTYGCDRMDQAQDEAREAKRQAARNKYEKKLRKEGIGTKVSHAFSACMQTFALHKMGYGMVAAPMAAYFMRKNGAIGKDLSSGIGLIAMSKGGALGHVIHTELKQRAQEKEWKKEADVQSKLKQWDRMYGDGSNFQRNMKASAANATKDARNGLFLRFPDMPTTEREIYRSTHGRRDEIETMMKAEDTFLLSSDDGRGVSMSEPVRKKMAKDYIDRLTDRQGYYKEALNAVETSGQSASVKKAAKEGLAEFQEYQTRDIVAAIKDRQDKYHIFNVGDQRDINRIMVSMGQEPVFDTESQHEMAKGHTFQFDLDPSGINDPVDGKPVKQQFEVVSGMTSMTEKKDAMWVAVSGKDGLTAVRVPLDAVSEKDGKVSVTLDPDQNYMMAKSGEGGADYKKISGDSAIALMNGESFVSSGKSRGEQAEDTLHAPEGIAVEKEGMDYGG